MQSLLGGGQRLGMTETKGGLGRRPFQTARCCNGAKKNVAVWKERRQDTHEDSFSLNDRERSTSSKPAEEENRGGLKALFFGHDYSRGKGIREKGDYRLKTP